MEWLICVRWMHVQTEVYVPEVYEVLLSSWFILVDIIELVRVAIRVERVEHMGKKENFVEVFRPGL